MLRNLFIIRTFLRLAAEAKCARRYPSADTETRRRFAGALFYEHGPVWRRLIGLRFAKCRSRFRAYNPASIMVAVDLMAYADDRERALRASGNKDVRPHDL
jgi:hypothetical protein